MPHVDPPKVGCLAGTGFGYIGLITFLSMEALDRVKRKAMFLIR